MRELQKAGLKVFSILPKIVKCSPCLYLMTTNIQQGRKVLTLEMKIVRSHIFFHVLGNSLRKDMAVDKAEIVEGKECSKVE